MYVQVPVFDITLITSSAKNGTDLPSLNGVKVRLIVVDLLGGTETSATTLSWVRLLYSPIQSSQFPPARLIQPQHLRNKYSVARQLDLMTELKLELKLELELELNLELT